MRLEQGNGLVRAAGCPGPGYLWLSGKGQAHQEKQIGCHQTNGKCNERLLRGQAPIQ